MDKGGREIGDIAGKRISEGIERQTAEGAKRSVGRFQQEFEKSVRDMQSALKPIDLRFENNDARRNIGEIRKELEELGKFKIKTNADTREASEKIAVLHAQMAGLDHDLTIRARADFKQAEAAGLRWQKFREGLERDIEIDVKFNREPAERALGEFERRTRESFKKAAKALGDNMDPEIKKVKAQLAALGDSEFDIDVSTKEARAKLTALSVELKKIAQTSPNIDVKVDAGRAFSELFAIRELVGRLDGKDVDFKVESDSFEALIARLGGTSNGLDVLRAKGDAASSTFRSLNPLVAALALLLPAIGPAGAAAAGGIAAIGPAAAVATTGIGLLLLSLSGVSDAVKALGARQDAAAKDSNTAAKSMASAANSVKSAEISLADAERNAARSRVDSARAVADAKREAARQIASALDSQKQAQNDYADSVRDVQRAEKELADARTKARQDQKDLQNDIADNAIAIRQALIDEFNAKAALNATKADGSSTKLDIDQAQVNYDQAAQNIKELRDKQDELAAAQKKVQEGGVDGADNVVSAQYTLTKALEQQKKDYEDVGKAAKKVDQERADGARRVADALRNQRRAQADASESIKKAQDALNQAKAGLTQAAIDTGEMAAAQQKVEQAMGKLGPAGRKFALFIFSLQKPFRDFRADIAAQILPPLQRAMETFFSQYGPRAARFFTIMAHGVGELVTALRSSLDSRGWQEFFRSMETFGPAIQQGLGRASIKLIEAFAAVLAAVAPFTLMFANGLKRIADAFASWSASSDGQEAITKFMQYAAQNGPVVVGLFVAFAKALAAVVVAAAPLGGQILGALTDFFNFIASIPADTLATIVQGVVSLVLAIQAAAVVGTIILSISAAFASVLQMVVAGTVLAVFHFGSLRDAVKELTTWIFNNRVELARLVKAFAIAYISFKLITGITKAYSSILAIARGVQFGFATATGRSTKAVKINTAAAKAAHGVTTAWLAITRALTGATIAQNLALLANPYVLIAVAIIAFIGILVYLFKTNQTVHDAIMKVWHALQATGEAVFGAIGKAVQFLWPIIRTLGKIIWTIWVDEVKIALVLMLALFKLVFLAIKAAWTKVLHPALKAFGDAMSFLWNKVVKPILGWIADRFETLGTRIKKVWDNTLGPILGPVIGAALEALKHAFKAAIDFIGGKWDDLKAIFAAPIKFVVDTVLNDGLFAAINKLASWVGVDSLKIDKIKLPAAIENAGAQKKATGGILNFGSHATGGVLPGYTPGRDPHKFYSPTGGRLELSGGEAIMRPEFTRAVGTGFVDQMNALARRGGVGAVQRALGGHAYAKGGVYNPDQEVFINGMGISRIAAAQVALAQKLFGIPIYMIQGGFGGNGVKASGTSHNYPGVGDFGPGSIALETALRKVGFAAWARNVDGRSDVGSGAHVHAISLLDPGDAGSPQVYGSWANYGNGLSGYGNDPAPHYPWVPGLADKISAMGISDIATLVGAGASHNALSGISHLKQVLNIVKGPFEWVKSKVMGPLDSIKDKISGSPLYQAAAAVPQKVVKAVTDRVWDLIPGPVKSAAGWAGDAAGWVVGGVGKAADAVEGAASSVLHGAHHVVSGGLHALGFADGGILPYNGTMKYDNGGYLPPGLTSVVNLTGKPEPVFTSDQWGSMDSDNSNSGGINYSPTFMASDLTAGDVAEDLNFELRRLARAGKYGGH